MTRRKGGGLGASSGERFGVFEFNEEDEQVERASERFVGKFGTDKRKRNQSSPIHKYKFLKSFAGLAGADEKKTTTIPIDIEDDGVTDVATGVAEYSVRVEKKRIREPIDVEDDPNDSGGLAKNSWEGISGLVDVDDYGVDQHCVPHHDGPVVFFSHLDTHALSNSSNHENMVADIKFSDDEDDGYRHETSFSSTSVSSVEENNALSANEVPEYGSIGHKIDHTNMRVVVYPDFVIYGDMYMTNSILSFSQRRIRIEGSAVNGVKGEFTPEWTTDDIIKIESEWHGRVETATVNIFLKSNISSRAGNANENEGADKLKFSVYDSHWHQGQEAIKSLDVRYTDVWNSALDGAKNILFGHNGMVLSKPYLPVLEPFHEVIYPKGDPDAVSISKRDLELLQPETFINDTVVDFYLKYLKAKIKPEDQHRFHFFNCFFFRKLADLDKDQSSACDSRAAFERVRKWTRKVNLFEKDFIFIPVNYSLHWSLIVICHPGEVVHDDDTNKTSKVPCILHMDSIKGSHRGLKNLFQSYLLEEWKERHNETEDVVSSKFLHLRFVPLELPQQENSYDCGLFLLHYVELFLEEAPINFSPFKITSLSKFLNRDWFPPEEASLKRMQIHCLICDIFRDQSVDSTDKYYSTEFPEANENETGVEIIEQRCSLPITCEDHSPSFTTELGIHSAASPQMNSKGLFESGRERSLAERNFWQTGRRLWSTSMSPIVEVEETEQQISDSPSNTEVKLPIAELAPESPEATYVCNDHTPFGTRWEYDYVQLEEDDNDDDPCSASSSCSSQKSSEKGLDEDYVHQEFEGEFEHCTETDEKESCPTSSNDMTACVVEDSEEENTNDNGQRHRDSTSLLNTGCNDNIHAPSVNDFESKQNNLLIKNNIPIINLDLLPDEPAGASGQSVSSAEDGL